MPWRDVSFWIAVLATTISIGSLCAAVWSTRRQTHANAWALNATYIGSLAERIVSDSSILRFHGLDPAELTKAQITLPAFAYLVANVLAGDAYYSAHAMRRGSDKIFDEHSYRFKLCSSKETRAAWPFVRRMIADTPYVLRMTRTIEAIEAMEAKKKAKVDAVDRRIDGEA